MNVAHAALSAHHDFEYEPAEDAFDAIEPVEALCERAYGLAVQVARAQLSGDISTWWDDYTRIVKSVWMAYVELSFIQELNAHTYLRRQVRETRAAIEEMVGEIRLVKPSMPIELEDEPTIADVECIRW